MRTTATQTATEANKQVVVDFCGAISERRFEDFVRFMHLDVIDHNKIIHGEPDEPGAAFEGLRLQLEAFGEFLAQPQQLIAEGDTVVARMVVIPMEKSGDGIRGRSRCAPIPHGNGPGAMPCTCAQHYPGPIRLSSNA